LLLELLLGRPTRSLNTATFYEFVLMLLFNSPELESGSDTLTCFEQAFVFGYSSSSRNSTLFLVSLPFSWVYESALS